MNAAQRRRERRMLQERLDRQVLLQRSGGRPKVEVLAQTNGSVEPPTLPKIKFDFKAPSFQTDLSEAMIQSIKQSFVTAANPTWISFGSSIVTPPSVNAEQLEILKAATPYKVQPKRQVPDYVHVITAWRAWAVLYTAEGLRLKALGMNHIWEPKKQVNAVCSGSGKFSIRLGGGGTGIGTHSNNARHLAPQMDCTCGVWAFKEMDSLVAAIGSRYGTVQVLGQVSLWGRVVETTNGYRAQYAYPSELWLFDESLEELGLIYDVPVRMLPKN